MPASVALLYLHEYERKRWVEEQLNSGIEGLNYLIIKKKNNRNAILKI